MEQISTDINFGQNNLEMKILSCALLWKLALCFPLVGIDVESVPSLSVHLFLLTSPPSASAIGEATAAKECHNIEQTLRSGPPTPSPRDEYLQICPRFFRLSRQLQLDGKGHNVVTWHNMLTRNTIYFLSQRILDISLPPGPWLPWVPACDRGHQPPSTLIRPLLSRVPPAKRNESTTSLSQRNIPKRPSATQHGVFRGPCR